MNVNPELESTTEIITLPDGSTKPATEKWKSVNGAASVDIASGMDSRGMYYPTWSQQFDGTAPALTDGAVLFESPGDISSYRMIELSTLAGVAATSVQVLIMRKGQTVYEVTPIQMIDRSLVVGAAVQSTNDIKAVGNYYAKDLHIQKFKVIQNGGAITTAYRVRGSYGGM